MKTTTILISGLALLAIASLLTTLQVSHVIEIGIVPMLLRWVALLALTGFAYKKRSLTVWIFVSMLLGAEVGYDFPSFAENMKVLSSMFLKLIKTIIAPLLFGTLVVGIAGHSNLKQVGRMGLKALLYFEVVTTIALFIGLAAINLSKAGEGVKLPTAVTAAAPDAKPQTWDEIILHIFPENIAKSVADGQVLQIVVFSILFGIGLAMVKDEKKRKPVLDFAEGLSETMFKFTDLVMYFAPLATFGAIAYTVGHMGFDVVENLIKLLGTLYVALAVFIALVLLPVALIVKLPIKRFIEEMAEPVSIAFATASSEAALPKAMEAMENVGVPRKTVAFVMPMGYSFNLDGTTLYLALASVFVAQVAGIHLSITQQLFMVFTLMLTSKGVAGVKGASLIILMATAAQFGLPAEPIFIILGIDALMDMARTSVNVIGNSLATFVIARWEGEVAEAPLGDRQ